MKNRILYFLMLLPVLGMLSTLAGCSEEKDLPKGPPPIHLNVEDSLAMVDIYHALGLSGWDLTDIYSWEGIEGLADDPATNEFRIIGFTCTSAMRPKGEIPEAFKRLTALRKLVIAGKFLQGEIPSWLGEMESLVYLGIKNADNLTGEIPEELGNLKNLIRLDIVNCKNISGEIPKSLGNLENLTDLLISGTSVSGEIPEELSKLKKIERLDLRDNELSGTLPIEIMRDRVFGMDCSNNNIEELPFEIWKDEYIGVPPILDGNRLSGEIPEWVFKTNKWEVHSSIVIGKQQEGYGYSNYMSLVYSNN